MTSSLVAAQDVAPLPMWALWLPLVGVSIGGLLSAFGQWLAARSTHKSAEKIAALAERRELRQDERAAMTELLAKVGGDISALRNDFDPIWRPLTHTGATEDERPRIRQASDAAIQGVTRREVECSALAARVHSTVAEAARAIYERWGGFFHAVERNPGKVGDSAAVGALERAIDAQKAFHDAARDRLAALNAVVE